MLFLTPFVSLALHLGLRPRFWTPSLIVLGFSFVLLGAGEYVRSHSLWFALRNGGVFAFLFFCVSVAIGLVCRIVDRKTYDEAEKREMANAKVWKPHSRVLAVVAVMLGLAMLGLSWSILIGFEIKGTLLATFCFYLAWQYWRSPAGAPSVFGWILRGSSAPSEAQRPQDEQSGR